MLCRVAACTCLKVRKNGTGTRWDVCELPGHQPLDEGLLLVDLVVRFQLHVLELEGEAVNQVRYFYLCRQQEGQNGVKWMLTLHLFLLVETLRRARDRRQPLTSLTWSRALSPSNDIPEEFEPVETSS